MCRFVVTSYPFVAVLLLAFGGAVCQDPETPPTQCFYKDNGVKKSCAIFQKMECNTTGLHSIPMCNLGLDEGHIDGLTDYNATFGLWASKGYFAIHEDDECWKFETGGRQYPEACVRVTLDYVPNLNGRDIAVWGDNDHCAYLYNSLYIMQHYTDTNGTIKVHFSFQTEAEIQQLDLVLVSAKYKVNCSEWYKVNGRKVSLHRRRMRNVSATEVFTGLRPGYYCMKATHGDCAVHTLTNFAENASSIPQPQPDGPEYLEIIVVACFAIAGLALIIILVIWLKRRSYGVLRQLLDTEEGDPPTHWQSIHQQWAGSPDAHTELLLLYSRDCKEFYDVMQAFSQLLKSFGNVKVLDPMAQNQMEEVSENISGWMAQHLRNPNIKVVIVVSEGAKQRQRALLNNQIVHSTCPHFLDHVYTQALQQMHEDPTLGSNYTRIFPVRFEDFTPSEESLSLIVPLKCYVLQKHLGKLILELRGFNTQIGPDLEDIRRICPKEVDQLESTIRIMKSYCAINPHYISKHFSLVAPST